MQNLGHTRTTSEPTHFLQTPDSFVRVRLPGMEKAMAIVHASPALGARFAQYTAELELGGLLGSTVAQRFLYVLSGEVVVTTNRPHSLKAEGYAYLPQSLQHTIRGTSAAVIAVIEKPYVPVSGEAAPQPVFGYEPEVPSQPLMDDEALQVRSLLPLNTAFDFAVNTMEYQPGAVLPMVESHIMEHGLLMLQGGGIYRLNDHWYPVAEGDFIWMAPYCPQWFGALGKTPAKYLIYKDFNRAPLD